VWTTLWSVCLIRKIPKKNEVTDDKNRSQFAKKANTPCQRIFPRSRSKKSKIGKLKRYSMLKKRTRSQDLSFDSIHLSVSVCRYLVDVTCSLDVHEFTIHAVKKLSLLNSTFRNYLRNWTSEPSLRFPLLENGQNPGENFLWRTTFRKRTESRWKQLKKLSKLSDAF